MKQKLEDFCNLCKEKGLKVTPQRIEIYKTLLESKEHPSAEIIYAEIHKKLPNVSFDTVNRTLNTLAEIGAAFIVEGTGEVRRFDANLESHQHIKCIKCKKIFDFSYKNFENINVPENLANNFKVLRATVYIEGLCKSCQENKNN
ncbi:MAG: transcriptional repressor [Planctomycetaceae bacterium]|nr:transcriptional repressor [Planctomycetaceae bacterium]